MKHLHGFKIGSKMRNNCLNNPIQGNDIMVTLPDDKQVILKQLEQDLIALQ